MFYSYVIVQRPCAIPYYKNTLTLSSEYTHFNTLKKKEKKPSENIVGKGEVAQNEQFYLFPQCFLCICILKSLSLMTNLRLFKTERVCRQQFQI